MLDGLEEDPEGIWRDALLSACSIDWGLLLLDLPGLEWRMLLKLWTMCIPSLKGYFCDNEVKWNNIFKFRRMILERLEQDQEDIWRNGLLLSPCSKSPLLHLIEIEWRRLLNLYLNVIYQKKGEEKKLEVFFFFFSYWHRSWTLDVCIQTVMKWILILIRQVLLGFSRDGSIASVASRDKAKIC